MITNFTIDSFDKNAREMLKVASDFHNFWASDNATNLFYPGGRSAMVDGIHSFFQMTLLDPKEVKKKLNATSKRLRDDLEAKKKAVLAEQSAMAAGALVTTVTSWIPLVDIAVALIDTGMNIGLTVDISNREKEISKLLIRDADRKTWLSQFSHIEEALNLYFHLLKMAAVKTNGVSSHNASLAKYLLVYIQAKELTENVSTITTQNILSDLSSMPPVISKDITQAKIEAYLHTEDTNLTFISEQVFQNLFYLGMFISSAPVYYAMCKNLISAWRYGRVVFSFLSAPFSLSTTLFSAGQTAELASVSLGSSTAADANLANATLETEGSSFSRVFGKSFKQVSKSVASLSALSAIVGVTSEVFAVRGFLDFEKSIDGIYADRVAMAELISTLWLKKITSINMPSDHGDQNRPHGWYDAQGLLKKWDYGRWVTRNIDGKYQTYWSVALAGSNDQYSAPGTYDQPGDISILKSVHDPVDPTK